MVVRPCKILGGHTVIDSGEVFVWMRKLPALVFVLSTVLLGCGEDPKVDTNIDEGSTGGSFSVNVSEGDTKTRPIYTWSYIANSVSDNTAYQVTVTRASDTSTPVWEVRALLVQNDIQSYVTHGTVPLNAAPIDTGSNEELDLQTDVWYRVTVTRADLSTTGYREFLIKP
jgi:hypothetical protein